MPRIYLFCFSLHLAINVWFLSENGTKNDIIFRLYFTYNNFFLIFFLSTEFNDRLIYGKYHCVNFITLNL